VGLSDSSNYTNVDTMKQWNYMSDIERQHRRNISREKLEKESGAHYVIDNIGLLPAVVKDINYKLSCGINP
jgi:hypothetical protein